MKLNMVEGTIGKGQGEQIRVCRIWSCCNGRLQRVHQAFRLLLPTERRAEDSHWVDVLRGLQAAAALQQKGPGRSDASERETWNVLGIDTCDCCRLLKLGGKNPEWIKFRQGRSPFVARYQMIKNVIDGRSYGLWSPTSSTARAIARSSKIKRKCQTGSSQVKNIKPSETVTDCFNSLSQAWQEGEAQGDAKSKYRFRHGHKFWVPKSEHIWTIFRPGRVVLSIQHTKLMVVMLVSIGYWESCSWCFLQLGRTNNIPFSCPQPVLTCFFTEPMLTSNLQKCIVSYWIWGFWITAILLLKKSS